MAGKRGKELRWHKLDNTAKIYPVITNNHLSGVYRISATLFEDIDPGLLKQTLNRILPWFEGFQVRLRRGVFWYYFETNKKEPMIKEETAYPCRYMEPYANNQFLFRVSYYHKRINLEVFHALTDGYGAINFMRELVCQYIRLAHPQNFAGQEEPLPATSFNMEDSYVKYYRQKKVSGYSHIHAYQLRGEVLPAAMLGVIHGYVKVEEIKRVSKGYGVSITQYLTAALIWSIYKEYLHNQPSRMPIRINVPVNLRSMFPSTTTRNFFAVIFAAMMVSKEDYSFEEILWLVKEEFEKYLTEEHLSELISYNVSNEQNIFIRLIPLFVKNLGVKLIYRRSSRAFTATVSNCGAIQVGSEYEPYIERFHMIMGASRKQPLKCVVCSYKDELVFTFSSVFTDSGLERVFCKRLTLDGIQVTIESNGVYDEKM
ncbi:MAG: hypothetical protein J6B06_07210 [Lachnospiraceae bacterium]|nr:hypothetical protein [Lachnospiraceae bacterium]